VALAVAWAFGPEATPPESKDDAPRIPEAIEIAHIEPPREPPPRRPTPKPAPAPRQPPPPPRPKPAPPTLPAAASVTKASASDRARGAALLRAGIFPRMRASYARIGFERYRDAVLALGGRFYLFDVVRGQPVAEIDPRSGGIREGPLPDTVSRWPRDVTRHVPDALARGRERYGASVERVVLLPPASLDHALLGALDRHLSEQGTAATLQRVDVVYELRNGRLHGEVLAVALADGSERTLGLVIDLSEGAPS
jgi:hypothetical protein